jgi:hypothetical protein
MGSRKAGKEQAGIRPDIVFCLWQYDESSNKWTLMDCFGVCDDGYAVTESKLAGNGRYPHTQFMNHYNEDDKDEENPIATEGRLVVGWSMLSGVSVIEFNPPSYPKWINGFFWNDMHKERRNILHFLQGGYEIQIESANAAEQLLERLRS